MTTHPVAGAPADDLPEELLAALADLARTETLLIALDFDGTLAPLQDDPSASRMLPVAAAALGELDALPRTHVALVSGRGLADLRAVSEAPAGMLLVGSHGAEHDLGHGPTATPIDAAAVRELQEGVRTALAAHPLARIEAKPRGAAVHTRGLDQAEAEVIARALLGIRSRADVLTRDGHDVLEFSVDAATKADGVLLLREHVAATAVLFAGDDVTDEDAIAALGDDDVGIRVGAGPSRARHRVRDAVAMAEVLRALTDQRGHAG